MGRFYFRVHEMGGQAVLAIADEESIGKKYEGGGRVLDLESFASFYKGELAHEEKIKKLLLECESANLAGRGICRLAVEHGFAKESHIVDIGGISHMQLYRIVEGK
ncbi:MAG: DUF424 family protein [Candidatus Micrarchaeota archaeon]